MKTPVKPNKIKPVKKGSELRKNKDNTSNPKKPGYDPDVTPEREVEQEPMAKPGET